MIFEDCEGRQYIEVEFLLQRLKNIRDDINYRNAHKMQFDSYTVSCLIDEIKLYIKENFG